jgi:hypothetical protein
MGLAGVHRVEVPTDALRNSPHSPAGHPRDPRPRCALRQGDVAQGVRTATCLRDGSDNSEVAHDDWGATRQ